MLAAQFNHELVDRTAIHSLQDVDGHDVSADRTNAAGHEA
jgi:hypothetical protein